MTEAKAEPNAKPRTAAAASPAPVRSRGPRCPRRRPCALPAVLQALLRSHNHGPRLGPIRYQAASKSSPSTLRPGDPAPAPQPPPPSALTQTAVSLDTGALNAEEVTSGPHARAVLCAECLHRNGRQERLGLPATEPAKPQGSPPRASSPPPATRARRPAPDLLCVLGRRWERRGHVALPVVAPRLCAL